MLVVRTDVGVGAELEEIRTVYEREFEAFVRTASAICGGREAGRDAVQDAMVEAVRTRERFRREGTVAAWLWRAVVRTALKHRSRVRLVSPLDEDAAVERPGHDASLDVRGLVARLPERQRLALFLRYYGGLEYAEIASALDVKVGTISATLNAAHAALRSAVEEVGHVGHP